MDKELQFGVDQYDPNYVNKVELKSIKKRQYGLTIVLSVFLILSLTLLFLTLKLMPKKTYQADPFLALTNGYLQLEIQSQEKVLHDAVHTDLDSGDVPISKALTILLRLADLQRLQSLVLNVDDKIGKLERLTDGDFSQEMVNQTISDIKAIQKTVSLELKDKYLGGTIKSSWGIQFGDPVGENLLP